jgi:hypothetical protein
LTKKLSGGTISGFFYKKMNSVPVVAGALHKHPVLGERRGSDLASATSTDRPEDQIQQHGARLNNV